MSGKKSNMLRDYHVLVARNADRFEWQIRYDRFANPVQRSPANYATHAEAVAAGEAALAALKRPAEDDTPGLEDG